MASKKRENEENRLRRNITIICLIILLIVSLIARLEQLAKYDKTPLVKPFTESENVTESTEVITSNNGVQNGNYTDSDLEVYFFDVGQADSILLKTDDLVMLVDTGNAGDADTTFKLSNKINLSHELNRLGISKIDYLIATHPHEDHMGSMYKILKTFDVKELYANNILPEEEWTGYYRRFVEALENSETHLVVPTTKDEGEIIQEIYNHNVNVENEEDKIEYHSEDYFRVGDIIPFGDALVTILAPNSAKYSDTNDYSIVIMVEFEDVRLLLTGDAGKVSENEMISRSLDSGFDLDCDILKVGHHGSRTASTDSFISKVKPEYAIIMVAEDNSYGLPDEDVLERLENIGAKIYMTKDVGDILLTIDNGTYNFDLDFSHEEKEAK